MKVFAWRKKFMPEPAITSALFLCLIIVSSAGCSSNENPVAESPARPDQVFAEWVEASNNRDCEKISDLTYVYQESPPLKVEDLLADCKRYAEQNNDKPDETIDNYRILEQNIEGDVAHLRVEMTFGVKQGGHISTVPVTDPQGVQYTQTLPFNLKNIEGEWKVFIEPR